MSSLKQNIKTVLTEVETFLVETLKSVKLSGSIKEQKTRLLEKVRQLLDDIDPGSAGSLSLQDSNASNGSLKISGGGESAGGSSSNSGSTSNIQAAGDKDGGEEIAKVAVTDLKNKLQAGLLDRKKASGFKSWEQTFCVVNDNILYLYKKQGDSKQKEAFCLNGYEFREAPELEKDAVKKDMCFELVRPGMQTYQFRAGSQEAMVIWKEAIVKGIQMLPDDVQEFYDDADAVSGETFPPPPPASEVDAFLDPDDIYEECANLEDTEEPFPKPPPPELEEQVEELYDACASELPRPVDDKKTGDKADQPPPLPSGGLRRPPPPPPPSSDQPPTPPLPKLDPPAIPRSAPPPIPDRRVGSSEPPPLPSVPHPSTRPGAATSAGRIPRLRKPFMDRDEDFENIYYGKWNCSAEDSGKELAFHQGDMIHVLSKDFDSESWWVGELAGKVGLVPKDYLAPAFVLVA